MVSENNILIKNKIRKYQELYRKIHREKLLNWAKEYYIKHRKNRLKKQKAYNKKHKNEKKEYDKKHYEEHKKEKKDYNKAYNKRNKEKLVKKWRKYYQNNKKEIQSINKKYYEKNKDNILIALKKYQTTLEGKLVSKKASAKRRHKENNIIHKFTTEQWINKLKKTKGYCPGYKRKRHFIGIKKLTMDHTPPISKVPKGYIYTINKVKPMCKSCNSRKRNKIYGQ